MNSARISECGKYRYTLTRQTDVPLRWVRPCLFIMLNPSTADATQDDATVRRCLSFAKSWQCTGLTVVNLFAYRATDPAELKRIENPEGTGNDGTIFEEIQKHRLGVIVAAWGNNPFAKRRAEYIRSHFSKADDIKCLGKNKNGSPKHPLYVPSAKALEVFP